MNIQDILARPVWKRLVLLPGFAELSATSIATADTFFDFIVQRNLPSPSVGDIHNWLGDCTSFERTLRIDQLQEVFAVCQPAFLPVIRETRLFLVPVPKPIAKSTTSVGGPTKSQGLRPIYEALDWDPIAPPLRRPPKQRNLSIPPVELPEAYKSALRRAADGLPAQEAEMQVPARSIVVRMREKLCQYAWFTGHLGIDSELSLAGIDGYLADLKQRLSRRPHGLRWATLRGSAEALLVFARYSGVTPEVIQHLKNYYREFEDRENGQKALKFFALARTGNSTDRILDMADTLLAGVAAEERPKKRHQMRNAATILAVFANAPLRNASAQLVFGETLFWERDEWVIKTQIQKTHARRPEVFKFPIHNEAGKFIDALVLNDASAALLPTLREKLLREKRQLFVLFDGYPAAASHVPRIFQTLTGNSFTTLRVMNYTDANIHHGIEGTSLAMPSAHHSTVKTVNKHYKDDVVLAFHCEKLRGRRLQRIENDRKDYGDLKSALESLTVSNTKL